VFANFETVTGGAANDTFNISGTPIINLNGGAGDDAFVIAVGTLLTGNLNGNDGSDTIDYSVFTIDLVVDLTALALPNMIGTFAGIENINTGSGVDTLTGDGNANILNGGPGNDTLQGGDGDDTYKFGDNWAIDTVIEAANKGNDTLDFSLVTGPNPLDVNISTTTIHVEYGPNLLDADALFFENLVAGQGDDWIVFENKAKLHGWLDGWDGADTLDYSTCNPSDPPTCVTAREFVLTALGPRDGFAGTEESIGGGFDNVNRLIGSVQVDSLTGLDAASVWHINSTLADPFALNDYQSGGRTLLFGTAGPGSDPRTAIENLIGGSESDTFVFVDLGTLPVGPFTTFSSIDGRAGHDTLDYHLYVSA